MAPDTSSRSVLYVEDDAPLRHRVAAYLESHGVHVVQVHALTPARELLATHHFDLIVLDLNLGREDGLELAKEIAARGGPGLIIASARAEDADRIMGLEVGADDYVIKPFVFRELLARIRAVTRRTCAAASRVPAGSRARFGRWTFDDRARRMWECDGAELHLTAGEISLLRTFLLHPQQLLQRHELLGKSRGDDGGVFQRTIDVLISRLRRKIETRDGDPPLIETVRGWGYRFNHDVRWDFSPVH